MKKNISILCLLLIIMSCICGCGKQKEETTKEDNLQQGADMSQVEIFGVEPKTAEITTTTPVETEAPKTATTQPTTQAPVTTTVTIVKEAEHISIYNRYNEFFNINQYIDYVEPSTQIKGFGIRINKIEELQTDQKVNSYKLNFSYIQYSGSFYDRYF